MSDTYSGAGFPAMGIRETLDFATNKRWVFVRTETGWLQIGFWRNQWGSSQNLRLACQGDIELLPSIAPNSVSAREGYTRNDNGRMVSLAAYCLSKNITPSWVTADVPGQPNNVPAPQTVVTVTEEPDGFLERIVPGVGVSVGVLLIAGLGFYLATKE